MATEEEERRIIHVEVDVRGAFSPFNFPSLSEVIRSIEVGYSDVLSKVVNALRGPLLGLYTIEADNYEPYLNKTVKLRGVELPITPRYYKKRTQGRKDGILVTIYDAYDKQN